MGGSIVHWTHTVPWRGSRMWKSSWLAVLLAVPGVSQTQPPAVVTRVCAACHPIETVTSQRRTRAQWQESIQQMVARGAKGSDEDLAQVLDYLARNNGPAANPAVPLPGGGRGGRGPALSPGPADKHVVDSA